MILGVDVGGTFTDAILAVDGRLITGKAPTTPSDQSEGVLTAVGTVLQRAGRRAEEVQELSHGMTVATNALLEGQSARTALAATKGFTDVIELARQDRPELYRLCAARPRPLVPDELRFGVEERMTPEGPLVPLQDAEADRLADQVEQADVEALAVVLLHSYRHPGHEQALADAVRSRLPGLHISLSHEVVGTFREFERASTTEVDAALSPLLAGYLRRLAGRCREQGLPTPSIMQSNGGLIDIDAAAGHAAWTILSGPAAGAAGAAALARASGESSAVCLDMGGTSCDVCVVDDGAVQERSGAEIAGRPLALPMLAVHTVGAGGGSIGWQDPGGALRVGPQSAGADPGPACYGRGGTRATVTDANLLLGYLAADTRLAGGVALDRGAAERAVAELAQSLRLEPLACAEGILRVAIAEMVRALRVVTVQRGIDPREYALLAFGGAGPLHAARIAEELAIGRVICPRTSGVLSALGLVVSQRRRDVQRTVLLRGEALTADAIRSHSAALADEARAQLGESEPQLSATFELRYRGQSFELSVTAAPDATPQQLRDAFEHRHRERYGYSDPGSELELVTIRITATTAARQPRFDSGDVEAAPQCFRRTAALDGQAVELEVLRGVPAPGTALRGPGVVELPESTVLIPPGWSGTVDAVGSIVLTRE